MKLGVALPIVDNESGHPHRIAGHTMAEHLQAMKRYLNAVADLL